MTGVYACLFEAGCDVTTVPSHLNLSITLNKVPDEWKEAIVSPVFKGGSKDRSQDPGNYRPISLTPCVARTMEMLVNGRVLNKMAGRHGAPRPPMTDVGTETAFRLEKAQAFPKK